MAKIKIKHSDDYIVIYKSYGINDKVIGVIKQYDDNHNPNWVNIVCEYRKPITHDKTSSLIIDYFDVIYKDTKEIAGTTDGVMRDFLIKNQALFGINIRNK